MSAEIREAVRAELLVLAQHLRATARNGMTYDDWLRGGLEWWIEQLEIRQANEPKVE